MSLSRAMAEALLAAASRGSGLVTGGPNPQTGRTDFSRDTLRALANRGLVKHVASGSTYTAQWSQYRITEAGKELAAQLGARENPSPARDADKAVRLYRTFHQLEPRKVGQFHSDFFIPDMAYHVGEARQVCYRSDKLNPTTGEDEGIIDYFHDHEGGVKMYRCDEAAAEVGKLAALPRWVQKPQALTALGLHCLGFTYKAFNGRVVDGEVSGRKPELYAIPSGRALLVVQDKRKVLAIMLGGKLSVGWRGIEG